MSKRPSLTRFLLELTPAENGFKDIQALSARSRAACDEVTTDSASVRLLRSVFVPEDGSCFLLFEASSAPDMEKVAGLAAVPVGRVWELPRA
jgi:hypothetical protein